MPIEQAHTEPNWSLLPGTILDGGYEMEELLQADERRAKFKVRVLGDRTIDAFASFFLASGTAGQEQLEAWELLRRIPHPNISKPLAAGQRKLAEEEVVYVVLQRADETLSGVLAERALTAEEATEVLLHSARALEHLGRHGLVHASLSSEEILAAGESVQLSAEGVRKAEGTAARTLVKAKYPAPESANGNVTTAASIWSLGATVFETLTQKPFGEESREKTKELSLGWILDRCLDPEPDKRCRPEEIPALLKSGPPPRVQATAPSIEAIAAKNPPEEAKPEGTALGAAAGVSVSSAATALVGGSAVPVDAPAKPIAPEAPVTRPGISSVSQARTKVFKQAEFDALTAPQGVLNGGGSPRGSASAESEGSLASTPFGASPRVTASRTPIAGARFEPLRAGASGARQTAIASPGRAQNEARRGTFDAEPEREGSRAWIYAAAGLVVLLLLFWALRSKPAKNQNTGLPGGASTVQNGAASPTSNATGKPAASSTAATSQAWPTRTLEPEKSASAGNPQRVGAQSPGPNKTEAAHSGGQVWRVVVYTFTRQEDAEKKAHAVNAKHPRLQAQVFSPGGPSGPYLVTLGGKMTREGAARFRSRALGSGMPRDSYIQNYQP